MKNLFTFLFFLPLLCSAQFKWPAHGGTLQDLIDLNPVGVTECDTCSGLEYDENEQARENLQFWRERLSLTDSLHWYGKAKQAYYNSVFTQAKIASASNADWVEIGPLAKITTPTEGIGPVEFVSFHPNQSGYMLTGNTQGGLFFSSNNGVNWYSAGTEKIPGCSSGIKEAVFDFSDPTAQSWFALNSGLGDLEAAPIFYEPGILRTTNGGASYDNIFDLNDAPLTPNCNNYVAHGSNTANNVWVALTKLIQDPLDANTLYVITTMGVYKTTNASASNPSWANVTPPIPQTLQTQLNTNFTQFTAIDPVVFVNDIEMSPVNTQELFVSARYYVRNTSTNPNQLLEFWSVMHTTDGGCTWNEVPNLLNLPVCSGCNDYEVIKVNSNNADLYQNFNLLSIAIDPIKFSSNTALYLIARNPNGGNSGSTVYGMNLSNSAAVQNIISSCYVQSSSGESFAVNDDIVVYPNGLGSGIQKLSNCFVCGVSLNGLHVDHEQITFNPFSSHEAWVSTHGGPTKASDVSNMSGSPQSMMVNGLGVAHCLSLADSYSEDGFLVAGLNHMTCAFTGTNYGSTGWGQSWTGISTGDGQKCLVNYSDGKKIYTSVSAGSPDYNIPSAIAMSNTRGASFYAPSPTLYESDWAVQAVANQVKPDMIYFVNLSAQNEYSTVMRSSDWGTTLDGPMTASNFQSFVTAQTGYQIDNTLPVDRQFRVIEAFTSPTSANYLYIHVIINNRNDNNPLFPEYHLLFKNKKADDPNLSIVQNSWEYCPLPKEERWFVSLTCDLDNPDFVTVSYSSKFLIPSSANGSEMLYHINFTSPSLYPPSIPPNVNCPSGLCDDWTLNLPNTGVGRYGIALEKGTDGGMYLSTDVGIFFTNNKLRASGLNWQEFGKGLPNIRLHGGIELNYKANKIRVGTFGRGAWEHSLYCPPDNDLFLSTTSNPEFDEAQNNIYSTAAVASNQVNYRAGNQVDLQPGFSASGSSKFHAFIHSCDHPGNSFNRTANTNASNKSNSQVAKLPDKRLNELQVYPNPTDGYFIVDLPCHPSGTNVLSVYDVRGTRLFQKKLENPKEILNLDLESGVYILQYLNEGQLLVQRIVISK